MGAATCLEGCKHLHNPSALPRPAADDVSPALVPLTNFALQPGGNDHSLLLFLTAGPCVYEFTVRGCLSRMRCCGAQMRGCLSGGRCWMPAPLPAHAQPGRCIPRFCTPTLLQLTQATGTILGVQPVQFVSWYSAAARTALSPTLLLAAAAGAAVLARLLA